MSGAQPQQPLWGETAEVPLKLSSDQRPIISEINFAIQGFHFRTKYMIQHTRSLKDSQC